MDVLLTFGIWALDHKNYFKSTIQNYTVVGFKTISSLITEILIVRLSQIPGTTKTTMRYWCTTNWQGGKKAHTGVLGLSIVTKLTRGQLMKSAIPGHHTQITLIQRVN